MRISPLAVVTIAALAGTTVPAAAPAQVSPAASVKSAAVPATTQAFLWDIDQVERKLSGLVEAIPDAKFGWRPGEGVRSVGEVVQHVAADNYFIPTLAGVAAPAATGIKNGDYPSVQAYETRKITKAEALQAMKESFAHLRDAMNGTDQAFLERSMQVFGQQMTGLQLWTMTTTHLHEHLGQLIAYARSNNVVPPWSK